MEDPNRGDLIPDLYRGQRGARIAGALLLAGAVAALLLMRTMTDDVHRMMFGSLGASLGVAAILIVVLTRR